MRETAGLSLDSVTCPPSSKSSQLQAPHLYERLKLRPPRGVLLYGPPGSGKTVLACAAAADAGAALFVLNGPDIISEYQGESEAGLQVDVKPASQDFRSYTGSNCD